MVVVRRLKPCLALRTTSLRTTSLNTRLAARAFRAAGRGRGCHAAERRRAAERVRALVESAAEWCEPELTAAEKAAEDTGRDRSFSIFRRRCEVSPLGPGAPFGPQGPQ